MEVNYKSDLYSSYIQVKIPEYVNKKQYVFQMLKDNLISGILPVEERGEEGESFLYLNITGKKNLVQKFKDKEMNLEEMTAIFQELINIFDELRNYLLPDRFVLTKPDLIYQDIEDEKLFVALLPWKEEGYQGLRLLAEFFLEKMNPHDEHGINVAYLFYCQQGQPNFSLYQFLPIMEKENILKRKGVQDKPLSIPPIDKPFGEYGVDLKPEREEQAGKIPKAVKTKEKKIRGIKKLFSKLFQKKKKEVEPEYNLWSDKEENFAGAETDYQETVFFEEQEEECWKLQWKEKGRVKTVDLKDFPLTVGKIREEVSVVIEDKTVSRIHCRFIGQESGIGLMDMNSTNGTSLNGMRLRPGEIMEIVKNDEILIGKVRALVV